MKSLLRALKIYPFFLKAFGYVKPLHNYNLLRAVIYQKHHKDFFFIQIGANDGKRGDPIYDTVQDLKLNGLALEPIYKYYNELKKNYKNTNVIPINKAVFESNTKVTLYKVKDQFLKHEWQKGITSLNPNHRKCTNTPAKYLEKVQVQGITFEKLFSDYKVTNIDLLQMDTEGYDFQLIMMFPFKKFKPKIIHFEHGLKANVMSKSNFLKILNLLVSHDYKIHMDEYDCLAYID